MLALAFPDLYWPWSQFCQLVGLRHENTLAKTISVEDECSRDQEYWAVLSQFQAPAAYRKNCVWEFKGVIIYCWFLSHSLSLSLSHKGCMVLTIGHWVRLNSIQNWLNTVANFPLFFLVYPPWENKPSFWEWACKFPCIFHKYVSCVLASSLLGPIIWK